MTDIRLVLCTYPANGQVEPLIKGIIEKKLAACVQVLPKQTSYYWWEDEVQKDEENLLLIKTHKDKYQALEKFIVANHPYEVPEVIAVNVGNGLESYLDWVKESIK